MRNEKKRSRPTEKISSTGIATPTAGSSVRWTLSGRTPSFNGRFDDKAQPGSRSRAAVSVTSLSPSLQAPLDRREVDQVHRRRPYELTGKDVDRFEEHLVGLRDLHDPAIVHQHDAVGKRHGLALVVRDIDRGDAELALQMAEFPAHFLAKLLVDRRQWLVEQQHGGIANDGTGKRHLLARAGRQGAGIAGKVVAELEDVGDPIELARDLGLGNAARLERKDDVFLDAEMRDRARRTGRPWRCCARWRSDR